jgi:hypothetical protein
MTINLDQYTNTLNVTDTATNADLNLTPKGTGGVKATNATNMIVQSIGSSGFGSFLAQGSTGNAAYYFGYVGSSEVGRITMTGNTDFGTSSAATLQLRVANTASAVNYVQATGAATGSGPTISAQGSDTNADLNFTTKSSGSTTIYTPTSVGGTASNSQNIVNFQGVASGNLVLLRASLARHTTSADWTGVGYRLGHVVDTTAMSYIEFNPVGQSQGLAVNVANSSPFQVKTTGGEQLRVANTASAVNYIQATGSATGVGVTLSVQGSDSNIQFYYVSKGTFPHSFLNSAGNEQFRVASTASAVNYVQVTGAATGGAAPIISSQGSDSNITLGLQSKGNASVALLTNTRVQFDVFGGGSVVNYIRAAGANTGFSPALQVLGSDTNIDLTLTPKGTGVVQFGIYTANMALTIQGYVEIKDSGGTVRRLAVIA